MDTVIQIGAIDNDRMLLEGMAAWISGIEDIRLVATAATVPEYLALHDPPKIVLLDLNLENFTEPADNVEQLVATGHHVIIMSVVPDVDHISATTEAGAAAYVTKDNSLTTLVGAIRDVANGDSPMTTEHAFWLSRDQRPTRPRLSTQERRVLEAYANGLTLDAAARRADIAPGTAKEYLARIKRKYADAGRPIKTRVDYATRLREDRLGRNSIDGNNSSPTHSGTPQRPGDQ